jgi:hypothetical protein
MKTLSKWLISCKNIRTQLFYENSSKAVFDILIDYFHIEQNFSHTQNK